MDSGWRGVYERRRPSNDLDGIGEVRFARHADRAPSDGVQGDVPETRAWRDDLRWKTVERTAVVRCRPPFLKLRKFASFIRRILQVCEHWITTMSPSSRCSRWCMNFIDCSDTVCGKAQNDSMHTAGTGLPTIPVRTRHAAQVADPGHPAWRGHRHVDGRHRRSYRYRPGPDAPRLAALAASGLSYGPGCVCSADLPESLLPAMYSTSRPCSVSLPAGSRLLFLFDTGLLAVW